MKPNMHIWCLNSFCLTDLHPLNKALWFLVIWSVLQLAIMMAQVSKKVPDTRQVCLCWEIYFCIPALPGASWRSSVTVPKLGECFTPWVKGVWGGKGPHGGRTEKGKEGASEQGNPKQR